MERKTQTFISALAIAVVLVAGTALTGVGYPAQGTEEPDRQGELVLLRGEEVDEVDQYGRIIDQYGEHIILDADAETQLELKEEFDVELLEERTQLSVKGYEFDRREGFPDFSQKLDFETLTDSNTQDALTMDEGDLNLDQLNREIYVVQMLGPRNPEWRLELEEMDVEVIGSIHNYGYEVRMSPDRAEKVEDLEFVEWVEIYQPGFKIAPELTMGIDDILAEADEKENQPEEAQSLSDIPSRSSETSPDGVDIDNTGVSEAEIKEKIDRAQPNFPDELVVEIVVLDSMVGSTLAEIGTTVDRIQTATEISDGVLVTAVIEDRTDLIDLAHISEVYHISPYLEPQLQEMSSQIVAGGSWHWAPQWDWEDPEPPGKEPETPVEPYRHDDPEWAPAGPLTAQKGYTGEDVIISVADTGIGDGTLGEPGHPDFGERVIGGYDWSEETDEPPFQDGHGHGTGVAGMAASDSYHGTGYTIEHEELDWTGIEPDEYWGSDYYSSMGVAPEVSIHNSRIADDDGSLTIPDDSHSIPEQAIQQHPELFGQTHSWGTQMSFGGYTERTSGFDAAVRDANRDTEQEEPVVITFSAGNDGGRGENTVGEPGGTAKNVVSVGGTANYQPDSQFMDHSPDADMWDVGSMGWTDDNRIKPDVAAPANNLLTTYWHDDPNVDPNYVGYAGTSFSSPAAQGAAAVIAEWYEEHPLVEGRPTPAMVRAILTNSAYDMPGDLDGDGTIDHVPNKQEGWGRIDLTPLVDHDLPEGGPFMLFDRVNEEMEETYLTTGEMEEYTVAPMEIDEPLKITLAWDDKEAPAGADQTLQNDLRLEVESPSGEIYRGNAFAENGGIESTSGYSYPETETMSDFDTTGDGYDDVNNLLSVYIEEPEPGSYDVRVKGNDIPEYANPNMDEPNQDFSLAVQNSFITEDGIFSMDSDRYAEEDTVDLTVIDEDMMYQDTTEIQISSIKDEGEGEIRDEHNVTLKGGQTGIVQGYIEIGPDFSTGEESEGLQVEHGDELEAVYHDETMDELKYDYAEVDGKAPMPASEVGVEWYSEAFDETKDHNRVIWETSENDDEETFGGYRIYRAESVDGEPSDWEHIDTVGPGTTEYIDEDMGHQAYTRHWYDVAAVDDVGNENLTEEPRLEPGAVRLDSPVGSETWTSGEEEEIEWYAASGGLDAEISAEYSTDAGETWHGIFDNMEIDQGEGSYTWLVDDVVDTNPGGLIRISIEDAEENSSLGIPHSESESNSEESTEPSQVSELRYSVDDELVELDWIEPDDGGKPITHYNIYRDNEVIDESTAHEEITIWEHENHTDEVRDVHEMDGVVYSASYDESLIAYDYENEEKIWENELESRVFGVDGNDGEVYASTETPDGGVYAFDAENGNENWSHYHHDGDVTDVKESSDGIIYSVGGVSGEQGELIAYDPEEDEILWEEEEIFHDLLFQLDVDETLNRIYTVSFEPDIGVPGQVLAYDYEENEVAWEHYDGPSSVYSVVEGDGVVYSGYYETIIANDAEDGEELWRASHHGDEPIWGIDYDDGYVYTGSSDNTIMISDNETGENLWRETVHDDRVMGIHHSENTLYSGGSDARVIALDPWLDIEATRYTDEEVKNFQDYTYQVSAVNEIGEGELSPPATVTPKPSLPDAPIGGDISDYFTLTEYEPPEFDTINSPQKGDIWYINTTEVINWTIEEGDGELTSLELVYSLDGGETWYTIDEIEDPDEDGDYDWELPNYITDEALISFRVEDEKKLDAHELSGEFEIIAAEPPEDLEVDHVSLEETKLFYDDLSYGEPEYGYETGEDPEGHNEWNVRDHGAYAGDYSWDFGDGMYEKAEDDGALSWMISPEVEIPENATWAELTFQHWRDFDWRYDGGNMRISTDGETWELIEPESGYPETISDEFENPLAGEPSWAKTESWEEVTFDLNEYTGETVQFEWRSGVDDYGDSGEGWRIDEIEVRAELPYKGELWHGDNRLTWEASPDDGAGEGTVIEYNIYRSSKEDELGQLIDTVEADGSEEYRYFDRGAGTDDSETWYYSIRAGTEEEWPLVYDPDSNERYEPFDTGTEPLEHEDYWHSLYGYVETPENDVEWRYEMGNAVGYTGPGTWYSANILDLSDHEDSVITDVAYYDTPLGDQPAVGSAVAHIGIDEDGAPAEPFLTTSEVYDGGDVGWIELELDEHVEVDPNEDYWIVMEFDDIGDQHFPQGFVHEDDADPEDPGVPESSFQTSLGDDPHDPASWSDEYPDRGAYGIEARIEAIETEIQAESDSIQDQEPLAPYRPPQHVEPEYGEALSVQKHDYTELFFEPGHGCMETSMDLSFYNAETNEMIGAVENVYAGEEVSVVWDQLVKGEYSWYVEIYDGDYLLTTEEFTFMVDYIDPEVEILMPEQGEILGDSYVTLVWEGKDDWSGIDYYEIRVRDYIEWTMVPSEPTGIGIENMPDDDHIIDVRATDNAGNQAIDSVEFTVNTAEPVVEIVNPQEGDIFNEDNVKVEWNGYDEHIDIDYYEIRVEDESWTNVGLSEHHVLSDLEEGENVIQVRGVDEAGNQYVDQIDVVYDPTSPEVDIYSPEEGQIFEQDWVEVNWHGFKYNSQIEKYEVRLNDQGWIDYEPSKSTHTFTDLMDGEHTLYVRAIDEAGNQHIETVTFVIDTPEAKLNIISPESGVDNLTYDKHMTIEGETSPDSIVYIDDEEVDVYAGGYFEYEITLDEGQNVFTVKSEHPEGDVAETKVYALYLPQIPEIQAQIDDIEYEIEKNRDAIEDLEKETDQLKRDIESLKSEIEDMQSEIEYMQSEMEYIRSEINALERKLEDAEEDIEELEEEEDEDEWWEIPGFTTIALILGAIIAIAIQHKKKQ